MSMPCVDAPEGAMQFEVKPGNELGGVTAPAVLWVGPPEPSLGYDSPCSCRWIYRVVETLLPDELKALNNSRREKLSRPAHFYVCACYGKVIE